MQNSSLTSRVLIVDDHVDGAQTIAKLLNEHGVFAVHVGNGTDALQIARFLKPHVVFVDMDMANKDGFSVLNEMKLLPELGAARFVAFTSVVDDEIKQRGTVDEFSQHIQKPASIAALLNLIH